MGRLYMSFLGTSDYVPCNYHRESDNFACENVRFVQEATIRHACAHWAASDRIVIMTTEGAFRKNWVGGAHGNAGKPDGPGPKGLRDCLEELGLRCDVSNVMIPEGKSEEEIWKIFDIVYDCLHPGDEVVFDITHAFRSIPMLALVVMGYAKVTKHVTLSRIYYGAFEVLGSPREAQKIPIEERNAPIFDLTPFATLLDWTVAIDRFAEAGDGRMVNTLARGGLRPILAETRGKDRDANLLRAIGKNLEMFCAVMATCRADKISETGSKLRDLVEVCENAGVLPPFRPLFERLSEEVREFEGESIGDGLAAAQWCLEHNLVQQSATILREVVVNHLLAEASADKNDVKERLAASSAITQAFESMRKQEPSTEEAAFEREVRGRVKKYLAVCGGHPGLVRIWGELASLRNDLNHAGYVHDPRAPKTFLKGLPKVLDAVREEISRGPQGS